MGGDGGSIPKRDDLVRTRTKPEQVNRSAELFAKWKHCAITQQPLQPPIVACELGRLYNKEAIIEFLLDRSKLECAAKFSYIRGLKDVKELRLTTNPEFKADASKAGNDHPVCQYICPVSGLEFNGRYRFCYFRGCGCVFSDRALKEIKDATCINCGKPYVDDDIITINGTDEEIAELRVRMELRRQIAKAKAPRKRKVESSTAGEDLSGASSAGAAEENYCDQVSQDVATVSTVGAKVPKLVTLSGAASASDVKPAAAGCSKDHKHKPKTIQDDPSASEVFKSLFNTHKTAKQQPKAHWVTYNPQYF
jgi:hypothetical protein